MMNGKKRIAMDLFSGCGGLTQGLEDAGFKVLAGAEIRSHARTTYKANHAGVRVYSDVRKIFCKPFLKEFNLAKGELDLLAACPPCQGFSSIRTRNGAVATDERNELIFQVARIVRGLLPKCVLIENVPRLLKDDRLARFKEKLARLGYVFSEGILNAADFDVPQRRKRMILIASLKRFGEPFGLPSASDNQLKVGKFIKDLPEPEAFDAPPLHKLRQRLTPLVQKRIEAIRKNRSELPDELALKCHKDYPEGFRDVYGRMDFDSVAPTITQGCLNPSKGRFIHPEKNRGITIYEAMLLQGFSEKYSFNIELGIGKIASMIGEAFPPPMAKAQARHIYSKLDEIEPLTSSKTF
ncbi:MAG: DNA cytosine methyltransferase [Puniceicoccales bacterium]|jgi:DNA (cytosine-5)-methyltransferase 1|nr:DNA cytosine methyltransferase [Puniceicoccales bacterium]